MYYVTCYIYGMETENNNFNLYSFHLHIIISESDLMKNEVLISNCQLCTHIVQLSYYRAPNILEFQHLYHYILDQ